MKKITYGSPEALTPSKFCKDFSYTEKEISYPTALISFKQTASGCRLELPVRKGEQFFGLGLQLKAFNLTGKHFMTRVKSDPVAATGDSHAPVPFFVSTLGYGIYLDTARYVDFDFGKKKAQRHFAAAPSF